MGCYAAWNGGLGSQADSSNIIIRRSHVEDNRAVHQGGVIQASANSSSEMIGCVVANNVAEYGAAISTQSCDQTLVAASTFSLACSWRAKRAHAVVSCVCELQTTSTRTTRPPRPAACCTFSAQMAPLWTTSVAHSAPSLATLLMGTLVAEGSFLCCGLLC